MAEKLKMRTENIADKNFEALSKLFPNAVTEAMDENGEVVRAIDADVLRQEISCKVVEGKEERYQFTWPEKKTTSIVVNAPINSALRPDIEDSINYDITQNVYIEGDNLDVLKLIQETYLGKIKMIYVDPPYNTGSDFIYADDFADNVSDFILRSGNYDDLGNRLFSNNDSSGRYHTNWLNMIYPRLKLARNLLTEDGAIFISIDDNEVHNLIKICDEIFGESNYVGCITRATGTTTGQDANKIGSSLDYCVVYSKSNLFSLNGIDMDEKDLKRFNERDEKGLYSTLQLRKTGNSDRKEDRPNMFYAIVAPDGSEVYPFGPSNYLSRWRVGKNTFDELMKADMIVWKENSDEDLPVVEGYRKSKWTPYVKYYLEGRTKQVSNLFQDIEGNKKASLVLKDLLGSKGMFDNPKPVEFITRLIQIATNGDDFVLDFFAGSATTGHAVMQYNAEKNASNRFILVQLPEACKDSTEASKLGYKTISEIGRARLIKAGERVRENFDTDVDTGFRTLKLDSSNMKEVYYRPADTDQTLLDVAVDNIKPDRTPEDLLFQVMLDLGVLLSSKIEEMEIDGKKVFNVADGFLVACFDKDVTDETIRAVAKMKPYYAVFRDSSMASDSVATNFDQIFASISPDTIRKVL